jgi:serine/threonine protein kinase
VTEGVDGSLLEDFLNSFDGSRYPEEFLLKYEQMECLSSNPAGETQLVRDRLTGEPFIVKCYTDPALWSNATEGELLGSLDHAGIPRLVDEYQTGNMVCIVREYAKEVPLDTLANQRRLSRQQVISICTQLCDILIYLHGRKPPVIHRDIKPQNIIVDGDGSIKLIDFGISRLFDKSASSDTVSFGTQDFAPPEQYGFSQTDNRSDIFSFGVLLCWLLTGESDISKASERISDRRLYGIVRRCTAFGPGERYKDASSLRDALTGKKTRRLMRAAAGLAAAAVIFAVMLASGFFDTAGPAAGSSGQAVFKEPLIEQAVRLSLSKSEGEEIFPEDLNKVEELYVFGDKAARDEEEYNEYSNHFIANDGTVSRGSITSLEDIAKLPNLRKLCISFENIADLTPLSQCRYLEHIEMRHNPLEDVSPLSGLSALNALLIYDTGVSDLKSLDTCPRLATVDVGHTLITSVSALDGLNSVEKLTMRDAPVESLDGIGTHDMLKSICLSGTKVTDLSPLVGMPRLETIEVSEDMKAAAEAVSGEAEFEIIYSQ